MGDKFARILVIGETCSLLRLQSRDAESHFFLQAWAQQGPPPLAILQPCSRYSSALKGWRRGPKSSRQRRPPPYMRESSVKSHLLRAPEPAEQSHVPINLGTPPLQIRGFTDIDYTANNLITHRTGPPARLVP